MKYQIVDGSINNAIEYYHMKASRLVVYLRVHLNATIDEEIPPSANYSFDLNGFCSAWNRFTLLSFFLSLSLSFSHHFISIEIPNWKLVCQTVPVENVIGSN